MKKQITLLFFFLSVIISIKATAQIEFEGSNAYGQLLDVTYSQTQEDVIYALTLTNHVVTSTDGGGSWTVLYSDPLDNYARLLDLKLINEGIDLPSLRFLKNHIAKNEITPIIKNDLRFFQGENVETFNSNVLKKFEENIIKLNNEFVKLNINFIVCVVPNKETKHRNLFKKVSFKNMKSMDSILNNNEILNINLLEEFDDIDNVYEKNDTHLSDKGSKHVSVLISNKIDSLNIKCLIMRDTN